MAKKDSRASPTPPPSNHPQSLVPEQDFNSDSVARGRCAAAREPSHQHSITYDANPVMSSERTTLNLGRLTLSHPLNNAPDSRHRGREVSSTPLTAQTYPPDSRSNTTSEGSFDQPIFQDHRELNLPRATNMDRPRPLLPFPPGSLREFQRPMSSQVHRSSPNIQAGTGSLTTAISPFLPLSGQNAVEYAGRVDERAFTMLARDPQSAAAFRNPARPEGAPQSTPLTARERAEPIVSLDQNPDFDFTSRRPTPFAQSRSALVEHFVVLSSADPSHENLCSICQEDYNDDDHPAIRLQNVPCDHVFGLNCIQSWINSGMPNAYRCPSCRQSISGALSQDALTSHAQSMFHPDDVQATSHRRDPVILQRVQRLRESLSAHIYDEDITTLTQSLQLNTNLSSRPTQRPWPANSIPDISPNALRRQHARSNMESDVYIPQRHHLDALLQQADAQRTNLHTRDHEDFATLAARLSFDSTVFVAREAERFRSRRRRLWRADSEQNEMDS